MTLAFRMDVETAVEAYHMFKFYGAETEDQRVDVLAIMIKQGFEISVMETGRTPDQILDDSTKHGSVLYMKEDGIHMIRRQSDGEERVQDEDYGICPNCERPNWDCSCYPNDTSSS